MIPAELRRTATMPTPATTCTDDLVALRYHIAHQDPEAVATKPGCFGPQTPVRHEGRLLTVGEALRLLDRWIEGRLDQVA